MQIIYVAIGGAAGAVSRYLINIFMSSYMPHLLFTGTTVVNITGCFIMGILFELFRSKTPDDCLILLLMVGFLGGFTTFSSFSSEAISIIEKKEIISGIAYIAVNLFGSLLSITAAIFLTKFLLKSV